MSASEQTILRHCPHCNSTLQVTEELLRQAEGMLRCGSCLSIFDGYREEEEFVAPAIPAEEEQAPLAQISVSAMSTAELPPAPAPFPWLGPTLGILLGLGLLTQVIWQQLYPPAEHSVSLTKLVVRPHPQRQEALRVDAILHNRSLTEQLFPSLHISFRDQYGAQQAQRSFLPAEYLHGELRGHKNIPARSSVQVSLTLQDPGQDATNYSARLLHGTPPAD